MLKFIKSLFSKKAPVVSKLPPLEKRGVIARKQCELYVISLVHNGGDSYTINTTGRYTKSGTGSFRYGEFRARQCFDATCAMYGAK